MKIQLIQLSMLYRDNFYKKWLKIQRVVEEMSFNGRRSVYIKQSEKALHKQPGLRCCKKSVKTH